MLTQAKDYFLPNPLYFLVSTAKEFVKCVIQVIQIQNFLVVAGPKRYSPFFTLILFFTFVYLPH